MSLRSIFLRRLVNRSTTSFPSINQVNKHVKIPQTLHIDKVVVDLPVVMQRQVPRIQTVDDRGRPADTVRWQSYGGADGMRQVACPKCGCLTMCVEDDACDECGEYSHIRECAACIWHACTRCTEAAQAAKLPWEARRRRGRGRHWW